MGLAALTTTRPFSSPSTPSTLTARSTLPTSRVSCALSKKRVISTHVRVSTHTHTLFTILVCVDARTNIHSEERKKNFFFSSSLIVHMRPELARMTPMRVLVLTNIVCVFSKCPEDGSVKLKQ